MNNALPPILTDIKANNKNEEFHQALFSVQKSMINSDNYHHLINIYSSSKQLNIRNKILKLLYDFDFDNLEEFFIIAYKKERYLDMKIYALRGLSQFIPEKDISKLLNKFNTSLSKIQETTPYNYQEYELLKGKNALPYLLDKYNYACFRETLQQVNKQYNNMPDAFKNHFTTDENGEIILLKKPSETKKILDQFFNR